MSERYTVLRGYRTAIDGLDDLKKHALDLADQVDELTDALNAETAKLEAAQATITTLTEALARCQQGRQK
jgi:chromosome segregation ATPase